VTSKINGIYAPSDDIVAREIEGELIIVPLVAGIGDMEDELFTLNDSGKAIWDLLDGKRDLNGVIAVLCENYESSSDEITQDVLGLVEELMKRRILVDTSSV
jgi:hypothetical protein